MKNLSAILVFPALLLMHSQVIAQCVPLIEPTFHLEATGTHGVDLHDIANSYNAATLLYDDGSVETIHWTDSVTYQSYDMTTNDLIAPYMPPVKLPPGGSVVMDERYSAVGFTTADGKKLVNILKKNPSGLYTHLSRRLITPHPDSWLTDLALTPARSDGTRFLFVSWTADDSYSGVTVYRIDPNVDGDASVIPSLK